MADPNEIRNAGTEDFSEDDDFQDLDSNRTTPVRSSSKSPRKLTSPFKRLFKSPDSSGQDQDNLEGGGEKEKSKETSPDKPPRYYGIHFANSQFNFKDAWNHFLRRRDRSDSKSEGQDAELVKEMLQVRSKQPNTTGAAAAAVQNNGNGEEAAGT
jgi:hypothetical protein